jgi:hypothetical protein
MPGGTLGVGRPGCQVEPPPAPPRPLIHEVHEERPFWEPPRHCNGTGFHRPSATPPDFAPHLLADAGLRRAVRISRDAENTVSPYRD